MWRWSRRDLAAIAFVFILLLGLVAWAIVPHRLTNYGFGPGWSCTHPGKGDPVCIKDPPKAPP